MDDLEGVGRREDGVDPTTAHAPATLLKPTRDELQGSETVKRNETLRPAKKPRKQRGKKDRLSKGYRGLVNATITDIVSPNLDNADGLPPSQVGASLWSTTEKDRFFTALSSYGIGNLPALATAVRTKTEAEIRAYLLLLQAGVREAAITLQPKDDFMFDQVPAAWEVGAHCEEVLDVAATSLAEHAYKLEAEAESVKYADGWLIDAHVAARLEKLVNEQEVSSRTTTQEIDAQQDNESDEGLGRNNKQSSAGATQLQNIQNGSQVFPSVRLLNPAAFLSLSRSLFMNSAAEPELNWQHLCAQSPDTVGQQDGPAMFRTAFDDFYNLCISLTRRLVQASIFQAMSRLRAKHDPELVAAVRMCDVHSAARILGVKADAKTYWATLAKRCGVEVFSSSNRFNDGRMGTKAGYSLSYAEVEAEMCHHSSEETETIDPKLHHHELDFPTDDSDFWTSASDGDEVPGSPMLGVAELDDSSKVPPLRSDESASESLTEDVDPTHVKRYKRPRNLSQRSREKLEDRYLDSLDHMEDLEEEHRLWQILGQKPPDNDLLEPQPLKCLPPAPKEVHDLSSWRDKVQYEAPWEREGELPSNTEFQRNEKIGQETRKRKRAMVDSRMQDIEATQDISTSSEEFPQTPDDVLDQEFDNSSGTISERIDHTSEEDDT